MSSSLKPRRQMANKCLLLAVFTHLCGSHPSRPQRGLHDISAVHVYIEEMFMCMCVWPWRCRVAALYADTGPGATGRTWRGRAVRQLPMPECQMHANTHKCIVVHAIPHICMRAHVDARTGRSLDAHKLALGAFLRCNFKGCVQNA